MKSIDLPCGYTLIPYIYQGAENPELSPEHLHLAKASLQKLQVDRLSHRLGENYRLDRLHLDRMFIYNVVYDSKAGQPVLVSGVQPMGTASARVFSRYFVFPEYQTDPARSQMFAKIDDFEVLRHDLSVTNKKYPFIFWTRDKGVRFFERLKKARADIFAEWEVYPSKVELLYKGNFQGLFYLNLAPESAPAIIRRELEYSASN